MILKKKFYTKTRVRVLGSHDWLKSKPLIVIGSDPSSLKGDNFWVAHKGRGAKDIEWMTQNAALFVGLF